MAACKGQAGGIKWGSCRPHTWLVILPHELSVALYAADILKISYAQGLPSSLL